MLGFMLEWLLERMLPSGMTQKLVLGPVVGFARGFMHRGQLFFRVIHVLRQAV
jgi:hypothetical protein